MEPACHISKKQITLTLDVEDGGGGSGVSLLDSPQPPQHLHGLWGADSGASDVEGNAGERGHVPRLLDKVRNTWWKHGDMMRSGLQYKSGKHQHLQD